MPKPREKKLTDREFLEASLYWPKWPMLPLVKRTGAGHDEDYCGFLFSHSREPEPIVYVGYVFGINDTVAKIKAETGSDKVTWGQILATMKKVEFPSLDAVLEAYRID